VGVESGWLSCRNCRGKTNEKKKTLPLTQKKKKKVGWSLHARNAGVGDRDQEGPLGRGGPGFTYL